VASYRVFIKPSAVKELERLPTKGRKRAASRIRSLAADPRPPGAVKLSGHEKYRLRQGVYRILYSIDDTDVTVLVVRVGQRRDVYR
jgi:mRNA interferase RelE/StbE